MEEILEVLKYVLPSLVVFATAYYLIKMMLNNEANKKRMDIALANRKITTPMRLRAFERVALLLERISLNSLIIRTMKAGMNANQLQIMLLTNIRKEFEHNMSQQIYLNDSSWQAVKMAKESTIKIINKVADSVKRDATAMELSTKILQVAMNAEKTPTDLALSILKNEIRTIL